jgi:ComF family protein
VTATLRYDFPANRLVRALKYRGDFAAGAALVQAMLHGPGPELPREATTDAATPWIVPVPLHAWRERRRGFNQAMELALPLARATGWQLVDRLKRVRRTPPQARLDGQQRRRNLQGAFRWQGAPPSGQTIVLVDDVLTTGATLEACTRALPDAGVVCAWVAARAVPRDQSDRRAQRS